MDRRHRELLVKRIEESDAFFLVCAKPNGLEIEIDFKPEKGTCTNLAKTIIKAMLKIGRNIENLHKAIKTLEKAKKEKRV